MADLCLIREAAQRTGVPERTVRRWIARGELDAIEGPTGRRVDLAAVQELAAAHGRPRPDSMATAGQAEDTAEPVDVDADTGRTSPAGQGAAPGEAIAAELEEQSPAHELGEGLAAIADLLRHERERTAQLERERMELAGQVGYLQGRLAETQEQLRLLAPPADGQTLPRPWWRRIVRR